MQFLHGKLRLKSSNIFVFLFLTSIVCLMAYPMFQHKFLYGDDWEYHISRIECIKDSLLLNQFPAKIHAGLLNGYGYGSGLFYPNFFLYLPAALRILGFGLSASYKIFIIFIIIALIISTYFSSKFIFDNKYAALCATILYATSQTMILNMYQRTALGETIASIFIPTVVFGIFDLLKRDFSKPYILIIGFLGLMLSHTISLVIALIVTFIAVVLNFRIFLTGKNIAINLIIKIFASGLLVLLLSISFWMPMLEQFLYFKFALSQQPSMLSAYSLNISSLFSPSRNGLGFPLISLLILIFITRDVDNKQANIFLACGIFLAIATTKLFPWKLLEPLLNPIQFPWRLLSFSSVFLSLGIGGMCINFSKNKHQRTALLLIIFMLCSLSCINILNQHLEISKVDIPKDLYSQRFATGGGQEWLPLGTDTSLLVNPKTILTDNSVSFSADKKGTFLSFDYDSKYDCKYFDVPFLCYKGYHAKILKSDGSSEKLLVIKSPNNNLVRILNPDNLSGTIIVNYSGTEIQRISYLINLVSILGIIYYLIKRRDKKYELFKK